MAAMRVAVCADMEGLSGIDRYQHCFPSWRDDYRHGVRMLVGDLEAAIEGALEAGATEIACADWHYLGRNIPSAAFPDLPIRRLWQDGRPAIGPDGLGGPDAAVLVGVHAAAGNPEGFLSHTFWMGMSLLLDGVPLSEAALWALALGGEGIPVAVVAGDQRATEEAAHLLPSVRTVAVKAGTSRTSAILRPPPDAREELLETVTGSLRSVPEPASHPFPSDATIRFAEIREADAAARKGVGERTGERDVTAHLGSVHDLMPHLARALLATSLGTGPALADRLYPRRTGGWRWAWSTCLTGVAGWVERRAVEAWAREDPARYPRVGSEAPAD
ncbi:MAG TPA: M55 family metallopeptidase [Longimicrobiales bacterium]|nr:M55 family metallopeptidase [Longimicrobiales bacterium]